MGKRWFSLILAAFFLLLLLLAGFLFFRLRSSRTPELTPIDIENREVPGEVGAYVPPPSGRIPGFGGNIGSATVTRFSLESAEDRDFEVDGVIYPAVDLNLSFTSEGQRKLLLVTLVDKISYSEPQRDIKTEELSVSEIDFENGSRVDLVFEYIPKESPTNREAIAHLCELMNSGSCRLAFNSGFGNNPLNFSDYFDSMYEGGNTAEVDYGFLFPIRLIVFR